MTGEITISSRNEQVRLSADGDESVQLTPDNARLLAGLLVMAADRAENEDNWDVEGWVNMEDD